jgi:hypothetical protein
VSAPTFSVGHIAALQRHELDGVSSLTPAVLNPQVVRPASFLRAVSLARPDPAGSALLRRRTMADSLAGLASTGGSVVGVTSCSGGGPASSTYALSGNREGGDGDLAALLQANHPGLSLAPLPWNEVLPTGLTAAGILTGSPAPALPESPEDPGPIDRFLSGMQHTGGAKNSWTLVIVADRLSWKDVSQKLAAALAELRSIADHDRGGQPLAAYYRGLLQAIVDKLAKGRAIGLWSVSISLAASTSATLARAMALAQSVFAGPDSRPDPIRMLALTGVPELPARFTTPPAPNAAAAFWTGAFCSLVHSEELAPLLAIPRLERPGFEVRRAPRFRQALATPRSGAIDLGAVLDRGASAGPRYAVTAGSLTAHALVAGASGSGKTNTVFHLLRSVHERGIPFLVIEPTKTEYRALLEDPAIGPYLKVYTPGHESLSPLRLNPFEVPPDTPVQTHLDRLKALFNASFTMYAPMPQVLERCLIEIYEECGWDLATGLNARGQGVAAAPLLGALQRRIEEVVPSLGYDDRITKDVSAALRTRIDSLRLGAKGLMLDTRVTFDIDRLLSHPTIIELDAIGDDDEKAFLTGLLFSRLASAMMRSGPSGGALRHLTVIEEAHRLFLDVPLLAGSEVGNPKGKAVETFCNILSEIRAYGSGIVIVDQIPTRLARDAIKNTGLKIMHRMPAGDDREIMGRSMVQTDEEVAAGAALPTGVALMHSGGQGGSFEVVVPRAELLATPVSRKVADEKVRSRMQDVRAASSPPAPGPTLRQVQILLRDSLIAEQAFRLLQSLMVSPGPALDVLLPLLQAIGRNRGVNHRESLTQTLRAVLSACLDEVASAAGWRFDRGTELQTALMAVYDVAIDRLSRRAPAGDTGTQLRALWDEAGRVEIYPFPQCSAVCPDFVCRFRHIARRMATRQPLRKAFEDALSLQTSANVWPAATGVAERAVERALSGTVSLDSRRRIAGCFILHGLERDQRLEEAGRVSAFTQILAEVDRRIAAATKTGQS